MEIKRDSNAIREFIDSLGSESFLINNPSRQWWHEYLFHFSSLRNLIQILSDDNLYSRNNLVTQDRLLDDSADQSVINQTRSWIMDCVRLYFRPLNPTQFNSEGMRVQSDQKHGAHCAVPYYLLFDSKELLTRADSRFSKGNLAASGALTYISARALKDFPFNKIYSMGPIPVTQIPQIIFHRNAEVIFKDSLDLSSLKWICCRSSAEKITLINCLSNDLRNRWENKIYVDEKRYLFFKRWSYISDVQLRENKIFIHFSPDSESFEPFTLTYIFTDISDKTNNKYERDISDYKANGVDILDVPTGLNKYSLSIKLDGCVAYYNRFDSEISKIA